MASDPIIPFNMFPRVLTGLLLGAVFFTGCTLRQEGRTIAAVTGSRGFTNPKLPYVKVERLMDAITHDLAAAGYQPAYMHFTDPAHPYSYSEGVTGERSYGGIYKFSESLGCGLEFNRTRVHVIFSELAIPNGSHVYAATPEQRQASRVLAKRIADYLRAHLPTYYQVDVSYAHTPV